MYNVNKAFVSVYVVCILKMMAQNCTEIMLCVEERKIWNLAYLFSP